VSISDSPRVCRVSGVNHVCKCRKFHFSILPALCMQQNAIIQGPHAMIEPHTRLKKYAAIAVSKAAPTAIIIHSFWSLLDIFGLSTDQVINCHPQGLRDHVAMLHRRASPARKVMGERVKRHSA
jgi:hypothetical protein